jgi:hypothetical protein
VRIAYLPDGESPNAVYRSIGPMTMLQARGHEARRLDLRQIDTWDAALRWCDLLHIHRACDGGVVELARSAKAMGATVVWDDDDDVTRVSRDMLTYRGSGGINGARRLAARAKLFDALDLVTTTNPILADSFREGGAPQVEVIENYVVDDLIGSQPRGAGVRVGWVAGDEHRLDLERIPVTAALQRLLEEHPQLHVTAIGVDLGLRSKRYHHVRVVHIARLLEHVSTFDIGIAPLSSDLAINHSRSSIKLKEYAAVGVPWLASPIGPYAGLGEREGGRLVAEDRWYEELDALIRNDRARRKLAKRAGRWGRTQLLSRNVERWERALDPVAGRAHALNR